MKIFWPLVVLLFIPQYVSAETVLFLDFEGTITNNRGTNQDTITVNGAPVLNTSVKVHGNSSLELRGVNDYLKLKNSHDWDVVADLDEDWTIDFWLKLNSTNLN